MIRPPPFPPSFPVFLLMNLETAKTARTSPPLSPKWKCCCWKHRGSGCFSFPSSPSWGNWYAGRITLCLKLSPGFWKNTLPKSVHVVEILQNSLVSHVACQWGVQPGLMQHKCPGSESITVENHPPGTISGVNNLSCWWCRAGQPRTSAAIMAAPNATQLPGLGTGTASSLLSSSFRTKICSKNGLNVNMETRGFFSLCVFFSFSFCK